MTKRELNYELSSACWTQNTAYMPTKVDMDKLTDVAISYTISVLEGMQPKWTESDGFIQSEIDRQKGLLNSAVETSIILPIEDKTYSLSDMEKAFEGGYMEGDTGKSYRSSFFKTWLDTHY